MNRRLPSATRAGVARGIALRQRFARGVAALLGAGVVAATGCASFRPMSGQESVEMNVELAPDSALRAARTQLEAQDFKISAAGENAIVTAPHYLPIPLQEAVPELRGRHWMLRVEASRRALAGGSRMRVMGFLLPPPAQPTAAQGSSSAPATTITSENQRLYAEVVAAARRIEEAAGRAKR